MMKQKKQKKMINYSDEQKKILRVLYKIKLIYLIAILAFTVVQLILGYKIPLWEFLVLFVPSFFIDPIGKLITGFKKKGSAPDAKSN